MLVTHSFAPVFDENSQVLILGTFPSVKSRENGFYYGNPRNRFWQVMAAVFGDDIPENNMEKTAFLLKRHIAIWDVVHSCEIEGSKDPSIKNVMPNDLSTILDACRISEIYANGKIAEKLYNRHILPFTGRSIMTLPSTSPANAAYSIERLISAWRTICKKCDPE